MSSADRAILDRLPSTSCPAGTGLGQEVLFAVGRAGQGRPHGTDCAAGGQGKTTPDNRVIGAAANRVLRAFAWFVAAVVGAEAVLVLMVVVPPELLAGVIYLVAAGMILAAMWELTMHPDDPEEPLPEQECKTHGTFYRRGVCPVCERMVPRRFGW